MKKYLGAIWNIPYVTLPPGKKVAIGLLKTPFIRIFGSNSWKELDGPTIPSAPSIVKFSPNGEFLAVGLYASPYFMAFNTTTWEEIPSFSGITDTPWSMDFSQDSVNLYVGVDSLIGGIAGVICVKTNGVGAYPFTKVSEVGNTFNYQDFQGVSLSSDHSMLVVAGKYNAQNDRLIVWSPEPYHSWANVDYGSTPYFEDPDILYSARFNNANDMVQTCGLTSGLKIWNVSDWSEVSTGIPYYIPNGAIWSPDDSFLACWTDASLIVYETTTWTQVFSVAGVHSDDTDAAVKFSSDGELLIESIHYTPFLKVWDTATWTLHSRQPTVPSIAFQYCLTNDVSFT